MSKAESVTRNLFQSPLMIPVAYPGIMSKPAFHCGMVYSETTMFVFYIQGLYKSIMGSVRTYWTQHRRSDIITLARHDTTVTLLLGNSISQTSDGQSFNFDTDR